MLRFGPLSRLETADLDVLSPHVFSRAICKLHLLVPGSCWAQTPRPIFQMWNGPNVGPGLCPEATSPAKIVFFFRSPYGWEVSGMNEYIST